MKLCLLFIALLGLVAAPPPALVGQIEVHAGSCGDNMINAFGTEQNGGATNSQTNLPDGCFDTTALTYAFADYSFDCAGSGTVNLHNSFFGTCSDPSQAGVEVFCDQQSIVCCVPPGGSCPALK